MIAKIVDGEVPIVDLASLTVKAIVMPVEPVEIYFREPRPGVPADMTLYVNTGEKQEALRILSSLEGISAIKGRK